MKGIQCFNCRAKPIENKVDEMSQKSNNMLIGDSSAIKLVSLTIRKFDYLIN